MPSPVQSGLEGGARIIPVKIVIIPVNTEKSL